MAGIGASASWLDHSAGGQFIHRLLATQPRGIFEAVGAANFGLVHIADARP
jgi:hypothetical protein